MREPEITVLSHSISDRADGHHTCRLRLVGGDLASGWSARPGREAWCEVTIHLYTSGEDGWVGSFGGEVWPAAWPAIFVPPPRGNYGRGPNRLTERGIEIAQAAIFGVAGGAATAAASTPRD